MTDNFLTPCGEKDNIKEFLSSDKLIDKLKEHKDGRVNPLSFNEDELIHARNFFRHTNYYSFSIYKKQLTPYKNRISENPEEQYSFTDCLTLYDFDDYLRENLNHFAGTIECFLKATFVSSSCNFYKGSLNKAEFYLDSTIYRSLEAYQTSMEILNKVAEQNTSLTFTHHRDNKNNKFPFWVLVDELTFGEITKIVSGIEKKYIDNWVNTSFLETKPDRLKNYDDNIRGSMFGWFQSAWHIRNVCAHYSRIYGTLFKVANPSISAMDKKKMKINKQKGMIKNNHLMAYLMAFKNVLEYHSLEVQLEWNGFIKELNDKIIRSEHVLPNKLGFIDNWLEYLIIEGIEFEDE